MKVIDLWECSACGAFYADKITACDCYMDGCTTLNHYHATLTSAGNSPVIPEGWMMVPIEPTAAMFHAFNDCDYGRKSMRERYIQMIEAAPAQESE